MSLPWYIAAYVGWTCDVNAGGFQRDAHHVATQDAFSETMDSIFNVTRISFGDILSFLRFQPIRAGFPDRRDRRAHLPAMRCLQQTTESVRFASNQNRLAAACTEKVCGHDKVSMLVRE